MILMACTSEKELTVMTSTSTTTTPATLIGYGRTSTTDQKAGLDAQTRDLQAAGCTKVFTEHASGVDAGRPELARALDYVRSGDVFIVTKPDRLARSNGDLMNIVKQLQEKGVELRILSMDLDTSTATGKLMLTVLSGVAAFEREIMLERQREGIQKAKAAGKYVGRQPTARAKSDDVVRLYKDGVTPSDIGRQLGISKASTYRILKEMGALSAR
jgi:DNA invertase Pin-like site-specific DNA recombinase